MIHVFFGSDVSEARAQALRALSDDDPECDPLRITEDTYSEALLTECAGSTVLFGTKPPVLLDGLFSNDAFSLEVVELLPLLHESDIHFVIIEEKLKADVKKKFERLGIELHSFEKEKDPGFNVFRMTDALLLRDKKTLWILLSEAVRGGIPPEEIIGVLFWQMKILRLAEKTKSASEAGQKPFVYEKAKRALSRFKEGGVGALEASLVRVYHDGHSGTVDTLAALEMWVLRL